MSSARFLFVWVLSLAVLANVMSPRMTLAAFTPEAQGLFICHSSESGLILLPLKADDGCRAHCMALAGALLTPQPPAIAVALTYHAARAVFPARQTQSVAPRHADAQPRAPPAAA